MLTCECLWLGSIASIIITRILEKPAYCIGSQAKTTSDNVLLHLSVCNKDDKSVKLNNGTGDYVFLLACHAKYMCDHDVRLSEYDAVSLHKEFKQKGRQIIVHELSVT